MLKTRVTLGNISLVLLNLIKRFILVMFKLFPPMFTVNIHIFSLVHQLQMFRALTFVPLPYPCCWFLICIFNEEEFIYGKFDDYVFDYDYVENSHYCSSYFRISTK